jgi:hypothetical protein
MKKVLSACFLILLLSGCGNHTPASDSGQGSNKTTGSNPSLNCPCDEFPFPEACKSKCEVGEAVVDSVDVAKRVATVTIRRGGQTELKTIPFSALPISQPVEKGASFRTLFKTDASMPNSHSIVRFTMPAK